MRRSLPAFVLATVLITPASWAFSEGSDEGFTTGVAYPVITSTYDISPQIQVLPADPHPKVVPIHKIPGDRPFGQPKNREIREYGGWDATEQTPWLPPDPSLRALTLK